MCEEGGTAFDIAFKMDVVVNELVILELKSVESLSVSNSS
jgi:hypothetical protein